MAKKNSDFEKKLNELSDIVFKMENDDLNIDEAIKFYKKGITLSATLSKSLQEIETEIFELKKLSDDTFIIDKSDIE